MFITSVSIDRARLLISQNEYLCVAKPTPPPCVVYLFFNARFKQINLQERTREQASDLNKRIHVTVKAHYVLKIRGAHSQIHMSDKHIIITYACLCSINK